MRSILQAALIPTILCGLTSVGRADEPKPAEPKLEIAPKPGYAIGRVVMPDGKPIPLKGIKYHINIGGKSEDGLVKVSLDPEVDADGNYQQKLRNDFSYRFGYVYIEVPFNDQIFQLELTPIGDDRIFRKGEKGVVQNYVWRLQGGKPLAAGRAKPDEYKYTDWYGGTVQMLYVYPGFPPKDFHKCTFTLTPKGKRIDGSEGKEMTFTREYDDLLGELKGGGSLCDLALGNYTVTGVEVDKSGNKKALLFQGADKKFAESVEIGFVPYPAPNIGIDPKPLKFKRQGEK